MDNALYVLLSKELGLFKQVEIVADNIANSETPGFRNKTMIFEEYNTKENNKRKLSFSNDRATFMDMTGGDIQVTNKTFDLAINGSGFFMIMTPLGEAYTRAGNFTLNQNSELITPLGYPVLSNGGGNIAFEGASHNIQVNKNGLIIVNGIEMDQIGIVNFDNPQMLVPIGSSLFALGNANIIENTNNFEIIQGAIEKSNGNKIKELSNSVEAQRGAGAIVNMINSINNTEKILVKNLLKPETGY